MTENTPEEFEAVRRLISTCAEMALLAQMLGLDATDNPTPLCKEHGKPKVRRGDGSGWRCSRCDDAKRATPKRPTR